MKSLHKLALVLATIAVVASVGSLAAMGQQSGPSNELGRIVQETLAVTHMQPDIPDPDDPYHLSPDDLPRDVTQKSTVVLDAAGKVVRQIVREYAGSGELLQEGLYDAAAGVTRNINYRSGVATTVDATPPKSQGRRPDSLVSAGYSESLALRGSFSRDVGVAPDGSRLVHTIVLDSDPSLSPTLDALVAHNPNGDRAILRSTSVITRNELLGDAANDPALFAFSTSEPARIEHDLRGGGTSNTAIENMETADLVSGHLTVPASNSVSHVTGLLPADAVEMPSAIGVASTLLGVYTSHIVLVDGFATIYQSATATLRDHALKSVAQWSNSREIEITVGSSETAIAWLADGDVGDKWAFISLNGVFVIIHADGPQILPLIDSLERVS